MRKSDSASASHFVEPLSTTSAALAMLIAALWGGTAVAISFSMVSLPPVAVAAIRFAMASLFMLFWCRFQQTSIRLRRGQLTPALVAGLLLFLQISSFNIGVGWSNSSHGSMLINTFVFWVVAIEHFVTKTDRLTLPKFAGLALATIGVTAVLPVSGVDAELRDSSQDLPTLAGDVVLLVSAFLLGIRVVYVKQALRRIEPGKLVFWHDVFGVVLFTGYSMLLEEVEWQYLTTPAVLGLLYQGVLVAGLCFAIQTQLLRKHSASQISIFACATPLFGVVFAVILRHDPWSPWLFVSVVCVAIGIFLVNAGRPR